MGAFCSCLNGPKKDKVADERAPLLTDGSSTSSTARADSHILVLIDGDDFLFREYFIAERGSGGSVAALTLRRFLVKELKLSTSDKVKIVIACDTSAVAQALGETRERVLTFMRDFSHAESACLPQTAFQFYASSGRTDQSRSSTSAFLQNLVEPSALTEIKALIVAGALSRGYDRLLQDATPLTATRLLLHAEPTDRNALPCPSFSLPQIFHPKGAEIAPSACFAWHVQDVLPDNDIQEQLVVQPQHLDTQAPQEQCQHPAENTSLSSICEISVPLVQPPFDHLIESIKVTTAESGWEAPPWGWVGAQMIQRVEGGKAFYARHNMSGFKECVEQAEKLGYVQTGNRDQPGQEWIQLTGEAS